MNAGEICNREVVVAYRNMTLPEAAKLMREQDSISDALRLMRERGVRRVPVLTHSGALAGIITIDDVLDVLAEELSDVVHAVERERVRETRVRR